MQKAGVGGEGGQATCEPIRAGGMDKDSSKRMYTKSGKFAKEQLADEEAHGKEQVAQQEAARARFAATCALSGGLDDAAINSIWSDVLEAYTAPERHFHNLEHILSALP